MKGAFVVIDDTLSLRANDPGTCLRLIRSPLIPGNDNYSIGAIASRARLGGLLNFYFLDAA